MAVSKAEKEKAKLHLAYWGLAGARRQHPIPTNKAKLFWVETEMLRGDPAISAVLRSTAWMDGYISRMLETGVLQDDPTAVDERFVIVNLEKVEAILADKEGLGAEKLGWYLTGKGTYPWGREALESAQAESVDEEAESSVQSGDPLVLSRDDAKVLVAYLREVVTDNKGIANAMKLLVNGMKEVAEIVGVLKGNTIKEELSKIKNKLNQVDSRQHGLEKVLSNHRRDMDEHISHTITGLVKANRAELLAELDKRLPDIQTKVVSTEQAAKEAMQDIHTVSADIRTLLEEFEKGRKREVNFIYELLSDFLGGPKK